MCCNLVSTSSLVQVLLRLFWAISKPDTATPPALEAFPGPNITLFFCNTLTASGCVGMLAPSATHMQPFLTNFSASSLLTSFCVAQGRATSHLMLQEESDSVITLAPSWVAFSQAYCATFPEPEIATSLSLMLSPLELSISCTKYSRPYPVASGLSKLPPQLVPFPVSTPVNAFWMRLYWPKRYPISRPQPQCSQQEHPCSDPRASGVQAWMIDRNSSPRCRIFPWGQNQSRLYHRPWEELWGCSWELWGWTHVLLEFKHEWLTETHHLAVGFSLGVKIRAAFTTAHGKSCEAVLENSHMKQVNLKLFF